MCRITVSPFVGGAPSRVACRVDTITPARSRVLAPRRGALCRRSIQLLSEAQSPSVVHMISGYVTSVSGIKSPCFVAEFTILSRTPLNSNKTLWARSLIRVRTHTRTHEYGRTNRPVIIRCRVSVCVTLSRGSA